MSALKPLRGVPLTFWFCGGEILWRGDGRCTPIHDQNIQGLLDVFDDEMRAASAAGETDAAMNFGELFMQLSKAREAQEDWRRATSAAPVDPFQTAGRVVGHIITGFRLIEGGKHP